MNNYDVIEPLMGEMAGDHVKRVWQLAQEHKRVLATNHNGTQINVRPDSNIRDLYEKFDLQRALARIQL